MTKFTKGPWSVDDSHPNRACLYINSDGRDLGDVAVVYCPDKEREANAALISAAPTMADYIKRKADAGCVEAAQIWEQINAR